MPERFAHSAQNSNLITQLSLFVIEQVFGDLPDLLACQSELVRTY